jgi:hypothetical protein
MQVSVDQAAQASPSGNLARKVRQMFESSEDMAQAAAALRKHTAQRARAAQQTDEGLDCSASADIIREVRDMVRRYEVRMASHAVQPYGQDTRVSETVRASNYIPTLMRHDCLLITSRYLIQNLSLTGFCKCRRLRKTAT